MDVPLWYQQKNYPVLQGLFGIRGLGFNFYRAIHSLFPSIAFTRTGNPVLRPIILFSDE
jgi:hypothetical protein